MVYSIPDTPAHGSHERTIERRTRRPPTLRARPGEHGHVGWLGPGDVWMTWRGRAPRPCPLLPNGICAPAASARPATSVRIAAWFWSPGSGTAVGMRARGG